MPVEPDLDAHRGAAISLGSNAVAEELLSELSPDQIVGSAALHARSEGQRRMTALHGGRTDRLEIYPNLWAGVGLVRCGAGTALVGSHQEVANLIWEYYSLGFDEFILSGTRIWRRPTGSPRGYYRFCTAKP